MAKKFVKVTGLTKVFDVSTGNSSVLDTTKLKSSVSATADDYSILYILATASDAAYGYKANTTYTWSRGILVQGGTITLEDASNGLNGPADAKDVYENLIDAEYAISRNITNLSESISTINSSITNLSTAINNVSTSVSNVITGGTANKVWKTDSTGSPSWQDDTDTITRITSTSDGIVKLTPNTNATGYVTLAASHATSGVTAGSYGDTGNARTLTSSSSTFVVNNVSVNATGHVVSAKASTITMPATAFTDQYLNVTLAKTSKAYLTGVTTTPTATATQMTGIADTSVFLTTTSGQLQAESMKVTNNVTMQYDATKGCLSIVVS